MVSHGHRHIREKPATFCQHRRDGNAEGKDSITVAQEWNNDNQVRKTIKIAKSVWTQQDSEWVPWSPFWDPSIERERRTRATGRSPFHLPVTHPRSPWLTLAHPAREVRVFKAAWCG